MVKSSVPLKNQENEKRTDIEVKVENLPRSLPTSMKRTARRVKSIEMGQPGVLMVQTSGHYINGLFIMVKVFTPTT